MNKVVENSKTMNKEVVEYISTILDKIEFNDFFSDKTDFYKTSIVYRIIKYKSYKDDKKDLEIRKIEGNYGYFIVNDGEYVLHPINLYNSFWINYLRYISKIDENNLSVIISLKKIVTSINKNKNIRDNLKEILYKKLMEVDIENSINTYKFPVKKLHRKKEEIIDSYYNKVLKKLEKEKEYKLKKNKDSNKDKEVKNEKVDRDNREVSN